jgi:hypothetical protein
MAKSMGKGMKAKGGMMMNPAMRTKASDNKKVNKAQYGSVGKATGKGK